MKYNSLTPFLKNVLLTASLIKRVKESEQVNPWIYNTEIPYTESSMMKLFLAKYL